MRFRARSTPTGRPALREAFASFEEPVFRWWFSVQALSASGTMTQGVAQAWLVLRLGGRGLALGIVAACTFGPLLLGGPAAGALVDRVDRRRLLVATQGTLGACSALLATLTAAGAMRLWLLDLLALVAGAVNALDQPARQIYVFELVGHERTGNAIALNEVVINVSRVLGPAAGGALLSTLGVAACFAFNAATYVPPLAVLRAFRPAEPARGRARERGAALAGLRYAFGDRAIRGALAMAAAAGALFNFGVALPLLARDTFATGGGGYALMMGAFGIGAVGGALVAASRTAPPRAGQVASLGALSGAVVLLTSLAPHLAELFGGLVCCGFASIWFVARANTFAQLRATAAMRGRVMSVWTMALPGMNPITGLLTGLIADSAGPRLAFGFAGALLVLTAALAWLTTRRRDEGVAPDQPL